MVNPRTDSGVAWNNGNVYAGHDGNVYQHNDDGWQKHDSSGWQPVQRNDDELAGSTASAARAAWASSG